MMTSEELLNILDDLDDVGLSRFQWFLQQPNIVQGLPPISESRLQTLDRCDTVDVMVETYGLQTAVQMTRVVLDKISRNDQRFPASSSGPEGVSEVKLKPNTTDTELDPKRIKSPTIFKPEMQTESEQISYRFRCAGSGVFQCAETGLVFDVTEGVELLYRMVQWDESRLKPTGKKAAGPMFDIRCSEEAAVRRLHFPHCETKDALRTDHLLSVANSTDDKMNILEPLQITDTHVVVEVDHLSLFGLIWDAVKRWLSLPVKGQVLLFLCSPKRGPQILHVHLLQKNIPPSQVAAQKKNAEYIEILADCSFITGRSYSLCCEPEGLKIQPECENFDTGFGPHFHPTFQVLLETNPDVVTLIIQDQEEKEVWKCVVPLKERDTEQRVQPQSVQPQSVQPQSVQPQRVQPQSVQPQSVQPQSVQPQSVQTQSVQPQNVQLQERLSSVRRWLIQGMSDGTVNQILDKLYEQKVISAEEMNIIRAQSTREDKARELIDRVHRKGGEAVSCLLTALHEIDPYLYRDLNLM